MQYLSGTDIEFPRTSRPAWAGRTKKIADNIRKIHRELADYSDEFLSSPSVAELKKATRDKVNAEAAKPGKRLETRHQQNYAKARNRPGDVLVLFG